MMICGNVCALKNKRLSIGIESNSYQANTGKNTFDSTFHTINIH
jgi:hypothetical protein